MIKRAAIISLKLGGLMKDTADRAVSHWFAFLWGVRGVSPWVVLLWLAIFAQAVSLFIGPSPTAYGGAGAGGACLIVAICLYQIARIQKWRWKWFYPVIGIFCCLVIYRIGETRSTAEAGSELSQAVSQLDPTLGAKLWSVRNDKAAASEFLRAAVLEAMQRAPDASVIEVSDTWHKFLTPDSSNYLQRCVRLAHNSRIQDLTDTENRRFLHEFSRFIFSAAGQPTIRSVDASKAQALVGPITRRIYPSDVLSDPSKFDALPESTQCQLYQDERTAIRALPASDAAAVLGYVTLVRLGVVRSQ